MGVIEATRLGTCSLKSLTDFLFKFGRLGSCSSLSSNCDAARMHWCMFRPVIKKVRSESTVSKRESTCSPPGSCIANQSACKLYVSRDEHH